MDPEEKEAMETSVHTLINSITNNNIDAIQDLLDAGADPNYTSDTITESPFEYALNLSVVTPNELIDTDILQLLVDNGANINVISKKYYGFHFIFSSVNKPNLFEFLINNNADITVTREILNESTGDDVDITILEYLIYRYSLTYTDENNIIQCIKILLDKYPALNVNTQDKLRGKTLLMVAAESGDVELLNRLLVLGADKSIMDEEGRTAVDYTTNTEIINILEDTRTNESEQKWKGFSAEDITRLDAVFNTDNPDAEGRTAADNTSFCPICAQIIDRTDGGCLYMGGNLLHNCKLSPYYHPELYEKYVIETVRAEWCTICGRICSGSHSHYPLTRVEDPLPEPIPIPHNVPVSIFGGEADCIKSGGGGLDEKLARFRIFRKKAAELQAQVGVITVGEAYRQIIEACWNPFDAGNPNRNNNTGRAANKTAKRFLNSYNFPKHSNLMMAANVTSAPSPAPNIIKPIPQKTQIVEDAPENVENVMVNFPEAGNPMLEIPYVGGYTERLTQNSLKTLIGEYVLNFGTDKFGHAAGFPEHQEYLYPSDVKGFVDDAVYERYKELFNNKFRHIPGIGVMAADLEQAGGRRRKTTRRQKKRFAKTLKKKNKQSRRRHALKTCRRSSNRHHH